MPKFSMDAGSFHGSLLLRNSKFTFFNIYLMSKTDMLNWFKTWIMTVTFVRRLLCCSELFVFNIDTQAVTSGEYGNMSKSDQWDLKGLYKICHNF